jgi:hypothetical protein
MCMVGRSDKGCQKRIKRLPAGLYALGYPVPAFRLGLLLPLQLLQLLPACHALLPEIKCPSFGKRRGGELGGVGSGKA